MIVQYIQSVEAQNIANAIHHTKMKVQYDEFVWNGDSNKVPKNKATPGRIKEIWGANKLFLDCTENEAIQEYSLMGFKNNIPVIPLKGITMLYATPKTIQGNENCIPIPEDGIEKYDLSGFTYEIIEIDFPEE